MTSRIYVGDTGTALYRSTDDGATWGELLTMAVGTALLPDGIYA